MSQFVVTPELKPFLNSTVGFVRVNKKFVHHNNSYECAAWWEDSEIQTGIYPLILKERYIAPHWLQLESPFQAIVVDDFFPALWGGVPVSRKPYVPKNLGEKRTIIHKFTIPECIGRTGNSQSDHGNDFFLNPLLWGAFARAIANEMKNDFEYLSTTWKEFTEALNTEDKYQSRTNSVLYTSKRISELANSLADIQRKIEYIDRPVCSSDLLLSNTSWIAEYSGT